MAGSLAFIHPLWQSFLLKSRMHKQLHQPLRDPDARDSTEPLLLSEDQDIDTPSCGASLQIIGLNLENKPSPAALTLKGPVIHIDGQ